MSRVFGHDRIPARDRTGPAPRHLRYPALSRAQTLRSADSGRAARLGAHVDTRVRGGRTGHRTAARAPEDPQVRRAARGPAVRGGVPGQREDGHRLPAQTVATAPDRVRPATVAVAPGDLGPAGPRQRL